MEFLTFVILDKLLDALLHHLPIPFPTLLFPLLRFLPLLLIFVAPLQHPFLHLIVFPCPLRSCSPPLIYDELYRQSFVPDLIKDILTEEAPNPPVTRSDIFGDDDTSDEDEVEHTGARGSYLKKER